MNPLARAMYRTPLGSAHSGDARHLLTGLGEETVDLVITSPPFALQRQKAYGNRDQDVYVDWLLGFCHDVLRVLRPTGSLVLDLGGAYIQGRPVRSLYNYRVLIRLCDELGFRLAEEFFWHNPAKLPSPIEWVNKRKIRAKDSVDTVWWLSKSDFPKADVRRVLTPYSPRMRRLLQDAESFYTPKKRPSGHDIGLSFATENDGAIPSNLLELTGEYDQDIANNLLKIPNTDSNSHYLRMCKAASIPPHPARFPEKLPAFFIAFLTDPGDLVVDIFAGSNTSGAAAQSAQRRWLAFELDPSYLAASVFRFTSQLPNDQALDIFECLGHNPAVDMQLPAIQEALPL